MSRLRIESIKTKYRLIKWSVLMLYIVVPFVSWFLATDVMKVSTTNAVWVVLAAATIMFGVLRFTMNYLDEGFYHSYADGGTWDYLADRFSVDKRPLDIEADNIWTGLSKLDRKDIVFVAEVGVSSAGIYININALGRILVPWSRISILKKHRIPVDDGWQQMVSITLEGPEIDISIPWQSHLDGVVPQSIGIG